MEKAEMFLRKAWYFAAWDHGTPKALSPWTIMNEKIIFFRCANGSLAALEDHSNGCRREVGA
jgi:phenylpropionate dioxygenase-like ring-hydroxylating dioxygenase large terminal subunit